MFNPVKMFQLLLISMLFVQLPIFAEAKSASKSKVSDANVKLKFDPKVYYRLSHKNRLKYLQIFSDLAVQMEKADKKNRKTADSDFYYDLQNLLFPRADAQATVVCLNGGIFFDKPASAASCSAATTVPEASTPSELSTFFTCGAASRCAAYFGVDSAGQGFCFDNASSATSQCQAKSTAANGQTNLRDKLNNCSANQPMCGVFQRAMAMDSAKIDQYCNANRNTATYCQTARTAATSMNVAAATFASAPGATPLDATSGCSEMHTRMGSSTIAGDSLSQQMGFQRPPDAYWMYLVTVASNACPIRKDTSEILKAVGMCESPATVSSPCASQRTGLGTCIRGIYETGTAADFAARYAGMATCRPGPNGCQARTGLQLKNDLIIGVNLDSNLEPIAKKLCPVQTESFMTCNAANPRASVNVDNPSNVELALTDGSRNGNRYIEASQAVNGMINGRQPSPSQAEDFSRAFGMSVRDFNSLFCAADATEFAKARQNIVWTPQTDMQRRMRNCIQTTVPATVASTGEAVQSNYGRQNCTSRQVTRTSANGMRDLQDYLYYESSTGLCRRFGTTTSTTNPSSLGGRVVVPCAATSHSGLPKEYVRLDHAVNGSTSPAVYACIDNLAASEAFQIYTMSCSSSTGNGGDAGEDGGTDR